MSSHVHQRGFPCQECDAITAPASCSEVVERLAKCADVEYEGILGSNMVPTTRAWFDREKATAILHSWRERRVQELEECLRIATDNLGLAAAYLRDAKCEGWADKILGFAGAAEKTLRADQEGREA